MKLSQLIQKLEQAKEFGLSEDEIDVVFNYTFSELEIADSQLIIGAEQGKVKAALEVRLEAKSLRKVA